MAVQDKNGGTCSNLIATAGNRICLDVGTHPVNGIQPKEIYSSPEEHVLKVRKPYTITKQRERWTEEEHKKFLEALTLYGRAWRRIEDHVGTKTAVQIRSHAQKFFSKVVRESSGSDAASVKPIEIPPPRPKRKPMHPYPRKLVHSLKKGMSIPEKPERSPSPNLSVSEQEYQSPKSVLSGFGSEMIGSSTVSNLNTNSPSPVSELLSEQETGYLSSTSSAKEENHTMPSIQVTANSTTQIESPMKFDFGSKDDACTKECSEGEAPKMSLKLFGRTVLVTDSHRPSSSTVGSSKSSTIESYEEKLGTNEEKQNPMQKDSNCSPWPCGMPPAFYYMQVHKHDPEPVEAISSTPVPWGALYGGLQFAFLQNPQSAEVPPEFSLEKEGVTGKGDKSGDVVNSQSEEPSSDKEKEMGPVFQLRSSKTSVFSERSDRCMKGFVPYKRCIAERDVQSSGIVREDREGQRIRLCL